MLWMIQFLGLDAKAKGFLVGFRTYIVAAIGVLTNLPPVLIGLAAILTIVCSMGVAIICPSRCQRSALPFALDISGATSRRPGARRDAQARGSSRIQRALHNRQNRFR